MINVFGTRVLGLSHEEMGLECQDHAYYMRIRAAGREVIIAAVADGLGSCSHSQFGSETAVKTVVNFMAENLASKRKLEDAEIITLLKASFNKAWDDIDQLAEDMQVVPMSFLTTLDAAVYDGCELWFGHAGDSGIVALMEDCTCKMVTVRQKGEEANQVIQLQSDSNNWLFAKVEKPVVAFAMLTDGLLDFTVEFEICNNAVYYPFYDQLFLAKADRKDKDRLNEDLYNLLNSPTYRSKSSVTDDMAMIVVCDEKRVPKYRASFSQEAWDEMEREKERRIREALYSNANNNPESRRRASDDGYNEQDELDFIGDETALEIDEQGEINVSTAMPQNSDCPPIPLRNYQKKQRGTAKTAPCERNTMQQQNSHNPYLGKSKGYGTYNSRTPRDPHQQQPTSANPHLGKSKQHGAEQREALFSLGDLFRSKKRQKKDGRARAHEAIDVVYDAKEMIQAIYNNDEDFDSMPQEPDDAYLNGNNPNAGYQNAGNPNAGNNAPWRGSQADYPDTQNYDEQYGQQSGSNGTQTNRPKKDPTNE